MKKQSRTDYAFAVGRVRALEKKMIREAVFKEAVEAKDFTAALKLLSETGGYPEELSQVSHSEELDSVLEKEKERLHRNIEELLEEKSIMEVISGLHNPVSILPRARESGYPFITDYIRYWIDLGNLKMLARTKYLEYPQQKLAQIIMKGGFLDPEILLQNYERSLLEMGEKLKASSYQSFWNQAVHTLEKEETFVELEKGLENFLMDYLKKAKYVVFGPEPVFAYALAKRKELNMIRLVGVGKINQIPASTLKGRISQTYVG
ncbi:V-type ATPase subunit [bacterium]|nr:V-type ATPase subunit [bacterium]